MFTIIIFMKKLLLIFTLFLLFSCSENTINNSRNTTLNNSSSLNSPEIISTNDRIQNMKNIAIELGPVTYFREK